MARAERAVPAGRALAEATGVPDDAGTPTGDAGQFTRTECRRRERCLGGRKAASGGRRMQSRAPSCQTPNDGGRIRSGGAVVADVARAASSSSRECSKKLHGH